MSAAYTKRALAARAAQGLPEGIEDPATLAALVDLLSGDPQEEHRRRANPTPAPSSSPADASTCVDTEATSGDASGR